MSQRVDVSTLLALQHNKENTRNFCILAHVDHGKTTLSDSLVSSNGIISSKMAGKLRFLDSTEEEQKRGITMHSSAIALYYHFEEKGEAGADATNGSNLDYLINLVDSPGHIDFSSDVSTAARLCDGALIVVDALEGVCTQTHAVIYKALKERMRPCLVLNKIDRLVFELRLTPAEAFHHLRRIIENVNALAFTLVNSEYIKANELKGVTMEDTNIPDDDPMVAEWTFAPEKGNVQFASAFDGWGFGLMKFINTWHKKLGLNKGVLRKYLFDDYSLNLETKKITKIDHADAQKQPMFATLVLEPIWKVYETLMIERDLLGTVEYAKSELGIQLEKREINARDPRSTLQSIMRRWLPLADSILRMVIRNMPNPVEAQRLRVQTLMESHYLSLAEDSESIGEQKLETIKKAIESCDTSPEAPLVVFVSKMMPVRVAELSKRDVEMLQTMRATRAAEAAAAAASSAGESSDETAVVPPPPPLAPEQEVFLALGRIFSGTLKRDSPVHIVGHKHDPFAFAALSQDNNRPDVYTNEAIPTALQGSITRVPDLHTDKLGCYLLLGPSIAAADTVPAGNIVGIVGLEDYILKTATISDTWLCPPLKAITFQSKPMLKVAVEPENPMHLRALEMGLQALNQFDPVVEIGVDSSGQRTMTCLGELHLDQCVKTLVDKFAKCALKVSEPLVSFREGVVLDDVTFPTTPTAITHPAFATVPPPLIAGSAVAALQAAVQAYSTPAELQAAAENFQTQHLPPLTSTAPPTDASLASKLPPPWCDLPGIARARQGYVRYTVEAKNVAVTIQAIPVPLTAMNHLEQDVTGFAALDDFLSHAYLTQRAPVHAETTVREFLQRHKTTDKTWAAFQQELKNKLSEHPGYADTALSTVTQRLIALGPRYCPTNLLTFHPQVTMEIVDNRGLFLPQTYLAKLATTMMDGGSGSGGGGGGGDEAVEQGFWGQTVAHIDREHASFHALWQRLHTSIVAGFHEAVGAGPLMHEPMHGVCFQINKIEVVAALAEHIVGTEDFAQLLSLSSLSSASSPSAGVAGVVNGSAAGVVTSIHTGQLISETKESMRLALLSGASRLIEPIFACNLQCDQSQLGNLYAVLSRRRGTVYQEDIIEGTNLFVLSAYLPVANSFHFAQELLKKTSGSGTAPQLSFSHWEAMASDPFWRPRTEEELEEFGEEYLDEHNQARSCIHSVRKRKGLAVDEQVVVSAEKQRTLKR